MIMFLKCNLQFIPVGVIFNIYNSFIFLLGIYFIVCVLSPVISTLLLLTVHSRSERSCCLKISSKTSSALQKSLLSKERKDRVQAHYFWPFTVVWMLILRWILKARSMFIVLLWKVNLRSALRNRIWTYRGQWFPKCCGSFKDHKIPLGHPPPPPTRSSDSTGLWNESPSSLLSKCQRKRCISRLVAIKC